MEERNHIDLSLQTFHWACKLHQGIFQVKYKYSVFYGHLPQKKCNSIILTCMHLQCKSMWCLLCSRFRDYSTENENTVIVSSSFPENHIIFVFVFIVIVVQCYSVWYKKLKLWHKRSCLWNKALWDKSNNYEIKSQNRYFAIEISKITKDVVLRS